MIVIQVSNAGVQTGRSLRKGLDDAASRLQRLEEERIARGAKGTEPTQKALENGRKLARQAALELDEHRKTQRERLW